MRWRRSVMKNKRKFDDTFGYVRLFLVQPERGL